PVALLPHEGYGGDVRGGHDLALLQLGTPVTWGPRVAPVCLPRPRHPLPFGARCWVTGWGHVAENGETWGHWGHGWHLGTLGVMGTLGTLGS
ncbi:PRS45 protease, partial [Crypturellus undulatus]|nr:PRS45 protease [Crypturellus undulatus]